LQQRIRAPDLAGPPWPKWGAANRGRRLYDSRGRVCPNVAEPDKNPNGRPARSWGLLTGYKGVVMSMVMKSLILEIEVPGQQRKSDDEHSDKPEQAANPRSRLCLSDLLQARRIGKPATGALVRISGDFSSAIRTFHQFHRSPRSVGQPPVKATRSSQRGESGRTSGGAQITDYTIPPSEDSTSVAPFLWMAWGSQAGVKAMRPTVCGQSREVNPNRTPMSPRRQPRRARRAHLFPRRVPRLPPRLCAALQPTALRSEGLPQQNRR